MFLQRIIKRGACNALFYILPVSVVPLTKVVINSKVSFGVINQTVMVSELLHQNSGFFELKQKYQCLLLKKYN